MIFVRSHFSPWRLFVNGFYSTDFHFALASLVILFSILCADLGKAQGLNASVIMSPSGNGPDQRFGEAVAGVGDVNGDDYDDLIVGANEAGSSQEGEVYLFFGGPNLDGIPDVVISGIAENHDFGFAIAGIGDINADGIDDFIIGAPVGQADTAPGAAYIFFGSTSFPATLTAADADITIQGVDTNDEFGCSVATLGDFDNDGTLDIAVGADQRVDMFGSAYGAGYVYVFLSVFALEPPTTISASAAELIITGEELGDDFGFAIGGGGDLNNDGYDDMIVGAPGNSGISPGGAYIVSGREESSIITPLSANSAGNVVIVGSGSGRFGYSVAMPGSINGDVYDDVVVGALLFPNGSSSAGSVFVFLGSATLPATIVAASENDMRIDGESGGDRFGVSVAGIGDINADSIPDFIVGATRHDAGGGSADNYGRGYIFPGSDPLPANVEASTAGLTVTGPSAGDFLGWTVGSAGDFDGDNSADVFAGAPRHSSDLGQTFVYSVFPLELTIPTLATETAYTAGNANTLVWSDESAGGATAYEVERAADAGFTTNVVSSGTVTELSYEFVGLTDGQTYYYRVRSGFGIHFSEWSPSEISTQDASPPVTTAEPLGAMQSTLDFEIPFTATDATSGVATVELFYAVDAGAFESYGLFTAGLIEFTAPGEGAYWFFTVGMDAVGNTETVPDTPDASTTVVLSALTVPTLVSVPEFTAGTANTVRWSDESANGATEYEAQRADDSGFTTNVVSSGAVGVLSYEFTGLIEGQSYFYRVRSGDGIFTSGWSSTESSTQIESPPATELLPNAPNPFNPGTTIRFQLASETSVRISIYTLDGKLVCDLMNETRTPGLHSVFWNGEDAMQRPLASGLLLLWMDAGGQSYSRRMLLLR